MSTGQSVLIVDDSRDYCLLLERAFRFQAPGLGVRLEHDGESAVEHLRACGSVIAVPSLVLLDRMLPGIVDGFGVLAAVRALPALVAVPIYMLSATHEPEHVEHARAVGADGYIGKPPGNHVALVAEILALRPWGRENGVHTLCRSAAAPVPVVDVVPVGMPPPPSPHRKLQQLAAACEYAEIDVSRAINLQETDTILDAKRRVVVRYLMAVGWSNLEVRDWLRFGERYLREQRAEHVRKPLLVCTSGAALLLK